MKDELSAKQVKAIALLVSGLSNLTVADEVGVTPQTICEWKKNPKFSNCINELKLDALESSREQLRFLAGFAILGLKDLMLNATNEEVRRKACMDVLTATGVADPSNNLFGWGLDIPDKKAGGDYIKTSDDVSEMLKVFK